MSRTAARLRRFGVLLVTAFPLIARAELPLARLHSVFPPGGQLGTTMEVTCEGTDLDDAYGLHFSTMGITAERNGTNAIGVFSISISNNVPPGIYETRVMGRFGISNPRFFTVDDRTNLIARGGNQSAETAMKLPMESTVNATATSAAADFYKFEGVANEPVLLACQAEPFDSQMKPALILFDAEGRELDRNRSDGRLVFTPAEAGAYIAKVHDLEFRGGKQFPYRLTITRRTNLELPRRLPRVPVHEVLADSVISEEESNDYHAQRISVPCEIRGQFFPERDIDRFEFDAKKGEVFWLEVNSDRLGQPTDPFVLVQRVAHGETETVSDPQEFYSSDSNIGGPLFNTASRDPNGRLEIKEDGTYRLQVRDLFNAHADPARTYRLSVRRETPDFDLVALIAPPPSFEKDKREAQVWSSFLRRNDTVLIKVLALRRDNFAGEIDLRLNGLPEGIQASECVIAQGQNAGWLSLTASDKGTDWTGPIQIVGKGKADSREIEHGASAMTVVWDVPDYNNESVSSRLMQELMLGRSTEASPLTVEVKQSTWQVPATGTVTIPIHLGRSTDFTQAVKVRAYVDTQNDPVKEWQVETPATDTTFELNVKELKLATGGHQVHFLAQTGGKIRRARPEEVASLEATVKKDEGKKKEIEERLRLRDVSATFSSPVVKVIVDSAPAAAR